MTIEIVAVEIGRTDPARWGSVTLSPGRLFALYQVVAEDQDDAEEAES